MKNFSFPKALASLSILLLAGVMQAQTTDENDANQPTATGNSKVRIVRLSQVKGEVQVDRHTGRGFEDAMANLPIVEGSQLRTVEGIAEVEFEDNSTLRLAPNSLIEFPSLERLPTGKTASSVHLLRGTMYVSLLKTQGNQFTLLFGERKLDLPPAIHIRVQCRNKDQIVIALPIDILRRLIDNFDLNRSWKQPREQRPDLRLKRIRNFLSAPVIIDEH